VVSRCRKPFFWLSEAILRRDCIMHLV